MCSNLKDGYGDLDSQEDDFVYPPEKADIAGNYKEVLKRFISYGHGGSDGGEALERFISAGNEPDTKNTETTIEDQKLHAHLRSCRNTVPVPDISREEEEDLQKRRGMKKRPYKLPNLKTKKQKPTSMFPEEIDEAHNPVDVSSPYSHENSVHMGRHWGALEDEEKSEEEDLGTGFEAIDDLSSPPETMEKPLYQLLKETRENVIFQEDKSGTEEGEDISPTPEDLNDLNHIVDFLAKKYGAKEESKK